MRIRTVSAEPSLFEHRYLKLEEASDVWSYRIAAHARLKKLNLRDSKETDLCMVAYHISATR